MKPMVAVVLLVGSLLALVCSTSCAEGVAKSRKQSISPTSSFGRPADVKSDARADGPVSVAEVVAPTRPPSWRRNKSKSRLSPKPSPGRFGMPKLPMDAPLGAHDFSFSNDNFHANREALQHTQLTSGTSKGHDPKNDNILHAVGKFLEDGENLVENKLNDELGLAVPTKIVEGPDQELSLEIIKIATDLLKQIIATPRHQDRSPLAIVSPAWAGPDGSGTRDRVSMSTTIDVGKGLGGSSMNGQPQPERSSLASRLDQSGSNSASHSVADGFKPEQVSSSSGFGRGASAAGSRPSAKSGSSTGDLPIALSQAQQSPEINAAVQGASDISSDVNSNGGGSRNDSPSVGEAQKQESLNGGAQKATSGGASISSSSSGSSIGEAQSVESPIVAAKQQEASGSSSSDSSNLSISSGGRGDSPTDGAGAHAQHSSGDGSTQIGEESRNSTKGASLVDEAPALKHASEDKSKQDEPSTILSGSSTGSGTLLESEGQVQGLSEDGSKKDGLEVPSSITTDSNSGHAKVIDRDQVQPSPNGHIQEADSRISNIDSDASGNSSGASEPQVDRSTEDDGSAPAGASAQNDSTLIDTNNTVANQSPAKESSEEELSQAGSESQSSASADTKSAVAAPSQCSSANTGSVAGQGDSEVLGASLSSSEGSSSRGSGSGSKNNDSADSIVTGAHAQHSLLELLDQLTKSGLNDANLQDPAFERLLGRIRQLISNFRANTTLKTREMGIEKTPSVSD